MSTNRIIIIGGGFAGVKCVKTLRKKLSRVDFEIVLFSKENHMVFHPLLAEVVGASINPKAVIASLRQMLPGMHCRTEEVLNIDLDNKAVEYETHEGAVRQMSYDYLVLACGSVVNLSLVQGMADHAFPLRTIGDAMALRHHIMQQLEKAEVCDDPELKKWYLSFIVVGGGFSGVEVAGEINDLVRDTLHFFPNISSNDLKVSIVHSRNQLLPEISPKLRDLTREKMEEAGINMVIPFRVSYVTNEGVGIGEKQMVYGATVVCTIGNAMSPVIERLDVSKEHGRLLTDSDMRIKGYANAWAVGDCALIINSYDNNPSPATGQFAETQGQQAAINMVRTINGEETKPYYFKPLGQLCSIGGHKAVADIFGFSISGVFAWLLWRGVYLIKMPTWSRRVKVGFDWLWQLVFSRDLAHPKSDLTERVSKAHYQPGDYIFHQGEPGNDFYIIEDGEVEVLVSKDNGGSEKLITVLGPGDFFGEMALVDNSPRNASIRAKTLVEVVVMGRNVFTQISSSLGPFRDYLAETIKERRAKN